MNSAYGLYICILLSLDFYVITDTCVASIDLKPRLYYTYISFH